MRLARFEVNGCSRRWSHAKVSSRSGRTDGADGCGGMFQRLRQSAEMEEFHLDGCRWNRELAKLTPAERAIPSNARRIAPR